MMRPSGSLLSALTALTVPIPPAAAHAPELAWLVAETPLPPSISGQTSLPAYYMGCRPLNNARLPGAARALIAPYRAHARLMNDKKEAGPRIFRSPALSQALACVLSSSCPGQPHRRRPHQARRR